jgi:aryl-alcohol dehydrogenase-like predicted oxidoreductase
MRSGVIDSVQLIYNIFEQEPAAQLLPVAQETGTGVIARVAFDEGVLTGKYTASHEFPKGDFRRGYFAGDRLERAVARVEKIKADLEGTGLSMPEAALGFVLAHPAVSTVIPGIRNKAQAEKNAAAGSAPPLGEEIIQTLRKHAWRRAFWYGGK